MTAAEGADGVTGDPYGRSGRQDAKPRCWRCKRLLAEMVSRPWSITCSRCKAQNSQE